MNIPTGPGGFSQSEGQDTLHRTLKELADFKFALDVSSIVAITSKDGEIQYVNDKFCEISKYSRAELIGQNHRIVNSKYHPREFFRDLWDTILAGKVWQGEIRNKAKDGALYWVHSTIVPFLTEKGKPYQFVVIHNEITKRKEMEEALSAFPHKILAAQENERHRISREIHDDLGQSLATLKMLIQTGRDQDDGNRMRRDRDFQKIITYLDEIINKTRSLASGLRPSTLEVLGLKSSLETLIADFRANKKLRIRASLSALEGLVFYKDAINVFRIIQEALTNIIKHARARKATVSMSRKNDRLTVRITDDGVGFSIPAFDAKIPVTGGLGLSTMRERSVLLGGEMRIISAPGRGTKLVFNFPVRVKNENT